MASSFSTGLLLGCIIGAVGGYCVQMFFSREKNIPAKKDKREVLQELFNVYPLFITQLAQGINDPANAHIREFFVVDKRAIMNSSVPRLRCDYSDELIPALNQLEDSGYIHLLPNDSLLYKMNEEFIAHLRSMSFDRMVNK